MSCVGTVIGWPRGRRQNVVRGQHQHAGFNLRFGRQRNVHSHLVAVEVGVERRANQRVNLDRFAFHQHRLKGLNAQAMGRRRAVQRHRVVLDHFFKNVPHHRLLHLHHFLRLLDGRALPGLLQAVIDERLEQFERHLLRQSALVQLQLRADHDHRTARIVDALAQQILAEAALLALQRVRKRLERTVVGAAQHAATAAGVEQRVHRFLQHALLVTHNHFRRVQVHQLLQPVVAVDDAAIEVIQIGGRKPTAIERHQRAQLRGNTGSTSRIIHRLFALLRKASTTLSRLAYLSFFCAEVSVFIRSRISIPSSSIHALEQFLDGSAPIMALKPEGRNCWSSSRKLVSRP